MDEVKQNGSAEDGAIKNGADGAVGALPHLRKPVFLYALTVGGDGGALNGNAVFLGGVRRVEGDLVLRSLSLGKTEVVVLRLEVHKGKKKLVLDHFPKDAGHLVAVHFDEGGEHFDFFHHSIPPNIGK